MDKRLEILIIEDNPGDAHLISLRLEECMTNLDLAVATRLRDGVRRLEQGNPDLILLDLILPDSSGMQTLRSMMSVAPSVPIIVLTGLEDEGVGEEAIRIGAQDYLAKDRVDSHLLKRAIRYAIERKHNEERLKHLNTCLRVIRDLDQLITHVKDPHEFVQLVCDKLVDTRGYEATWIVLADEQGVPQHFAFSGCCAEPSSQTIAEGALSCCVAAAGVEALATHEDWYSNGLAIPCTRCPMAQFHRSSSGIAHRLVCGDCVYGSLIAVLPGEIEGTADEREIFAEISEDVAFALHSMELESEREANIQALRDSEHRYSVIADSLPGGFMHIIDTEYRVLLSRGAELQRMGVTEAQMINRTLKEISPEGADSLMSELAPAFDGRHVEFERVYHDEVYLVNAMPLDEADGKVQSILVLGVNISSLKNAEAAHRDLEEQLRQAEKLEAVGQLAGGIAHDFNNQLGAILGYAEILQASLEDYPELRSYAENIAVSSQRSADLTKQLLTFSRKRQPRRVPVNIHELVREVVYLLERSIDKQVSILTTLESSSAITMGDASLLQNALLNLGVNARDAMGGEGELRFVTHSTELSAASPLVRTFEISPGSYLCVEVHDTGHGISAEVQKHMFEPYFTTKPEGKGTGMGLPSVYGTIKAHDGAIEVESQMGKGTVFKLYLPLASRQEPEVESRYPQPFTYGTGKILVVDDEEICRTMARDALRLLGYEVIECASGDEAVNYFRCHPQDIDLVVVDLEMPKLGGIDTIKAIHQMAPEIAHVVISGFELEEEHQLALEGIDFRYLHKPFKIMTLSRVVSDLLCGNEQHTRQI